MKSGNYNEYDLFLLGKKILFIAAIAFVGFCSSLIGKGSRFQARVVCVETMFLRILFGQGEAKRNYSISLDVFSLANEFLTFIDLSPVH